MAGDFSNISLFNVQVEISVRLHEMDLGKIIPHRENILLIFVHNGFVFYPLLFL